MSRKKVNLLDIDLSVLEGFPRNPSLELLRVISYISASLEVEKYVSIDNYKGLVRYAIDKFSAAKDLYYLENSSNISTSIDRETLKSIILTGMTDDAEFIRMKISEHSLVANALEDASYDNNEVYSLRKTKKIYETMLAKMLDYGSYITTKNFSPIQLFIFMGYSDLAKELLESFEDLDFENLNREPLNPTTISIFFNLNCLASLIDAGCQVDAKALEYFARFGGRGFDAIKEAVEGVTTNIINKEILLLQIMSLEDEITRVSYDHQTNKDHIITLLGEELFKIVETKFLEVTNNALVGIYDPLDAPLPPVYKISYKMQIDAIQRKVESMSPVPTSNGPAREHNTAGAAAGFADPEAELMGADSNDPDSL